MLKFWSLLFIIAFQWIVLDCICLTMTHVLQDILAILHKWGSPISAYAYKRILVVVHSLIPLYATMAWHSAEADTNTFVTQCPEEIHDLANERVVSILAFNRLQARHWVRIDYDIMLYRIHVLIIVKCQCDCCCLSSKDATVIWEVCGQRSAIRLTILEMAVDDCCCPHSLVNLRSVSGDFIMWSLSIAILSEFDLSPFSCDHAFADPFSEAVSLRFVFMCSWRKGWCLQGADRFYVNLCRYHGFLYFETDDFCRGLGHSPLSIWPRMIQISCGWGKFM